MRSCDSCSALALRERHARDQAEDSARLSWERSWERQFVPAGTYDIPEKTNFRLLMLLGGPLFSRLLKGDLLSESPPSAAVLGQKDWQWRRDSRTILHNHAGVGGIVPCQVFVGNEDQSTGREE